VSVRAAGRAIAVAAAALVAAAGAARAARAQGIASPGPLSTAHQRYDGITKCLLCHEAGRELSGRKCLACHTSLATRIEQDRGFHATLKRQGTTFACARCHAEHNGRPFRLVRWDGGAPERFDHAQAGFRLEGAHQAARCDACHREGLIADAALRADSSLARSHTYLGLGTRCTSCHLDEHRGRVSGPCEDCHDQAHWKPAPRFDHAKTRFALAGKHQDVRCAQCHTERHAVASGPGGSRDTMFVDFRTSRPTGAGCTGCHNSPHRESSRLGRCESCHTVDGWFVLADSLRTGFNHTRTGFALTGAHGTAQCEACHLGSRDGSLSPRAALVRANFLRPFARQPMQFSRCDHCHAGVHLAELPPARGDCVACHDDVRFAPTRYAIAMHDSTNFPLRGAHGAVPCNSCHTALAGATPGSGRVRFKITNARCAACHRDPHGGQFQRRTCESCHDVDAWTRVAFDHDSTRYPLRGAHTQLRCSSCHTHENGDPARPVRFRGLPLTCAATGCHTDPHGGQFEHRARGNACTTCHTEAHWRPAEFDHQTDSDWPIDGAHRRAPCGACHRPESPGGVVRFRPLPHRCEDCHR
jgi:hypothetical protein